MVCAPRDAPREHSRSALRAAVPGLSAFSVATVRPDPTRKLCATCGTAGAGETEEVKKEADGYFQRYLPADLLKSVCHSCLLTLLV